MVELTSPQQRQMVANISLSRLLYDLHRKIPAVNFPKNKMDTDMSALSKRIHTLSPCLRAPVWKNATCLTNYQVHYSLCTDSQNVLHAPRCCPPLPLHKSPGYQNCYHRLHVFANLERKSRCCQSDATRHSHALPLVLLSASLTRSANLCPKSTFHFAMSVGLR